jgi:simple sugar transport system ATP-binding protein
MENNVIELRDICKSFYGVQVLNNINLDLKVGEALCIAGENGSGKSTMIKIISGAYDYDYGMLKINGKEYPSISPSQSIAEGIQVIYQDFSLFPNLTVAENIGLSYHLLENKKTYNARSSREIARESLKRIGVELDLDRFVEDIPVAQKQIVAIARAIMQDAKVIIMDEPTTALTQNEIYRLYDIINNLKASGVSIIFVSHKLDEIFAVCDRVYVIRNGKEVANYPVEQFERGKLSYYMTGAEIYEEAFVPEELSEEPVFEVNGYSNKNNFKDISFKIHHGEILCITGRLGSGRGELAKTLFGVSPATKGEMFIHGKPVRVRNISEAIKNKMAYIPDDRLSEGIFLRASIKDNLVAVILDNLKNKLGLVNEKGKAKPAAEWQEKLAIKATLGAPGQSLSGGNQQRVVLGKWLASDPEVLILNCPTVGVDVKSKSEIHNLIRDMAAQDIAILLISDDIGEILNNSNRVIVMNEGKISFEAETKNLDYDSLSEKITEIL